MNCTDSIWRNVEMYMMLPSGISAVLGIKWRGSSAWIRLGSTNSIAPKTVSGIFDVCAPPPPLVRYAPQYVMPPPPSYRARAIT